MRSWLSTRPLSARRCDSVIALNQLRMPAGCLTAAASTARGDDGLRHSVATDTSTYAVAGSFGCAAGFGCAGAGAGLAAGFAVADRAGGAGVERCWAGVFTVDGAEVGLDADDAGSLLASDAGTRPAEGDPGGCAALVGAPPCDTG